MIEKKYLKSKPECKTKFALSAALLSKAKQVSVVGDFNNWDATANPMRKQKSGVYSSTINLAIDKSYQFRYLVDGLIWLNDEAADGYATSPISHEDNCIIHV
ncbi:isoamylase early set domain-containing protein [Marinomonas epiphytica]